MNGCGTFTLRERLNFNLIGHHEGRVEPHAELADEVRVVLARLELLQKRLRSRVRNRAQVLDQLPLAHPEPRVHKRDRLGGFVRGDGNFERFLGRKDRLPGRLQELEFLGRIGRVGDELPDENLFVGVKGMNDDLEQLGDLCLESMFFNRGRHRGADCKEVGRRGKRRDAPDDFPLA